ncbi:hypothetical protein B0A55_04663 [Friedmanniomyces simplex]|uniref:F-box domain-containing protein n=1 Tax=Friedmanniomyces simplex TaxID=329884 RepID=A0A4U0XY94_9PEZI|nr:hypothetical protein B0A55_04663 [Friedmanniomyces simplex]
MADDPGPGPGPPLLRLPREVHMHILTYLLRQGDKIPMGPKELVPKMSKKRRTLERDIRSLRPPSSKPPKKKEDHFPAVLLVHSDLYLAGVMTFWSGNTFVFGECDKLRAFISLARPDASSNISSIELGEAYHFEDVVNPGWDHEKNEPHPKQCLRRPTDSYWNTWPHPDWPISLELLAKLPKLRRLNLHVGALDEVRDVQAHGANDWTWETYYDQDTPPKHKSSLYLRDQVLLSIPRETLDNLQSLKMTYYVLLFLLPSCGQVTLNAEVLPYTKDLHNCAWNDPPHRPDPAHGETKPKSNEIRSRTSDNKYRTSKPKSNCSGRKCKTSETKRKSSEIMSKTNDRERKTSGNKYKTSKPKSNFSGRKYKTSESKGKTNERKRKTRESKS